MKKFSSKIIMKLTAAAVAAAAALSVLAVQASPVPAGSGKQANILLEMGQHKILSSEILNHHTHITRVKNDRPTVAQLGKDGTLYAKNPGNTTLQLTESNGKRDTIHVAVSCRNGLLKPNTLQRYGADSCDNLMVVAHPDDETLWGGAHLKNGNFFIVCLTNGNNRIRAKEYRNILRHSGSKGIILNYPDIYHHVKNDWSLVREGIRKDLAQVLSYKNWNKIVTYNPDGVTGHIHHRMTYADVASWCRQNHMTDHLYYFGKYYRKGTVPEGLRRLNQKALSFKESLVGLYWHERPSIYHWWIQMVPHENWVAYRDWK